MAHRVEGREAAYELANTLIVGDEVRWYDRTQYLEVVAEVSDLSQFNFLGYPDPERVFELEGTRGGEYLLVVDDSTGSGGFKEPVVFYRGSEGFDFEAALKNGFSVKK